MREYLSSKLERNSFFVDAAVYRDWSGKITPQNWGDDLNAHFLSPLFSKKLFFLSPPQKQIQYQFIGSIIFPDAQNQKRIIWGSGLLNPKDCPGKSGFENQTFLAVRGPLTRKVLTQNGIECPEIYGDPALLLPRFFDYTPPPKEKRRGVGIVSAWWEHKNPAFFNFMKKAEAAGAQRIKTRGYGDWRDFIKEICNSEFVISSSLHGVIVAEAYKIPCVWVVFSPKQQNEDHYFKYWDFYQSIGKNIPKPFLVTENTTLAELREIASRWTPGEINTDALVAACPFPLPADAKVK
ncbi:MAG: polysaccharide pyruvyl transferase family protein [Opitutales bacterium]|nr:polysaccharide pyruvyl transferase family protein [Opitutales bacterium]